MVILRRADHLHFIDDAEREHEAVRAMSPRSLALCYLEATLRHHEPARRLLAGDVSALLAAHGVEAVPH